MWTNRLPRLDVLAEEQVQAVHDHALTLLEEIGVRFTYRPALEALSAAGQGVDGDIARLDRAFVMDRVGLAPPTFEVRGRNPDRTVTLGGDGVVIAPTGGAPFVLDPDGARRPATLQDYLAFIRITHAVPQFHLNVSGLVEPDDLPVASRHLDMDQLVLRYSDKPFFAVGATAEDTRDSVALASIAFGGRAEIERAPVLLAIVNPISPLQYDERMAGSLMEYAAAGQPVVLMPFVFAGGTAPLGLAGALAQMAAEVLAGIALVQAVRPGTPCVFGSSVSEMNLHDGSPVFGTAFHGLAMLASGQLARRYGLPFRGGGAFTSSPTADVRAAQESLMSLWPTLLSGANLLLHAAGWLEGSLEASLEKLAQDLAPLEVLERLLAADLDTSEEAFALDAFREVGPGGTFLGAAHTLRHFRESAALRGGEPAGWKELLDRYEDPGMDPAIWEELQAFVARRKEDIERAAR